jgi:hypothetical protein
VPERAQQHHGAQQRAPDHRPHSFANGQGGTGGR